MGTGGAQVVTHPDSEEGRAAIASALQTAPQPAAAAVPPNGARSPASAVLPIDLPVAAAEGEQARNRGVVLTVAGMKGGIGKSTIATNIAAAIASDTDRSVLLIDMDTRFGDVAIMLDIEPRQTVADLAARGDDLEPESFRNALVRHECGVHILAAPKHPNDWSRITAQQMRALIQLGAQLFDYVILDTPGTFNEHVATAIGVADRVLMVSSLDMTSIKDTVCMIDLLEADRYPVSRLLVIINRVQREKTIDTRDVGKAVFQPIFCTIPYDGQVVRSTQLGRPVVTAKPRSRAAKQLRGLSRQIRALETPAVEQERGRGALRWLPGPLRRRSTTEA